jgi:hypothetical protein
MEIPASVRPEQTNTIASKNSESERRYFEKAKELAKAALSQMGIVSPTPEQYTIARNLLLYKGEMTAKQRKELSKPSFTQEMLLSILRHSVAKVDKTSDKKKVHSDCLILTHKEASGETELHIYLPSYIDKQSDVGIVPTFSPLVAIENLSPDKRAQFFRDHGQNPDKQYKTHLHLVHTIEKVDRESAKATQPMLDLLPTDPNLHITFDEIPFSRDQIKALQENTSILASEMPKKTVAVEIKSNKLARIVEESINRLPADSYLRTLAESHSNDIAQHIIDCLRHNSHPNLEEAQGYLFEALLALEVARPDSILCSQLDMAINGNKRREARPVTEIDTSSQEVMSLNLEYVKFHTKAQLHKDHKRPVISHGDYIFRIGGNQLGIIECKSSATPHIREENKQQLIATHENAKRYISWHNTQSTGLRLESDKIHLFIIKPRSYESSTQPKIPTRLDVDVQVHTLNSSIEYGHLERVWQSIASEYNIQIKQNPAV